MKNLYQEAKKCFLTVDPDEKLELSLQIAGAWEAGSLEWKDGEKPLQLDSPGRQDKPLLVAPAKVKNRGFKSIQQRAALIHALTHIELTAVNLAWDSIYRYRHLPKEYYDDLIKGVVDIKRKVVALGGEMHADSEEVLLNDGSKQSDLWGFNILLDRNKDECLMYESFINIRPGNNNRGLEVEDVEIREQMKKIIFERIEI